MNLNPLTRFQSIQTQEKHPTGILQVINKFLFCNIFTDIIDSASNTIDINGLNDSMAITRVLNIIINTNHYNNEHIIETILRSRPKIIKNIIKIVNCSSSGAILNLVITNHKIMPILGIKQNVDLMSVPNQHVPNNPIKSEIQLLLILYKESYDELKETYINNSFARKYFTYLCDSYKPGQYYNRKCRVMISPEELAGNNVVNLLKIITKCKGNNDIIKKVHDYAKKCTIKITEKELAAAFATLAVYKLANINYEVLNECTDIANTTPLAKDNDGNDNCDEPNNDIASCSHTIKVPNKDIHLKTCQQANKVAVNHVIEDGNTVHLSATDHSEYDLNTPQVLVNIEMTGCNDLDFIDDC